MVIWHLRLSEQFFFHLFHRDIAQSAWNRNSFEDVIFDTVPISSFFLSLALFLKLVHDLLQLFQLFAALYAQGDDELEEMPIWESVDSSLAEEIIDIGDISSEEVEGVGVVVLDGLGHVDDPNFILMVEHIVLTEIGVDEPAFLIQDSHDLHDLEVDLWPLFNSRNLCILESRGVLHVLSDEVHDQDIGFDQ